MVAVHRELVKAAGARPRFIYITGCDGTGKSTQATLLLERLAAEEVRARHVWLRFPFLLSIPLLAYARWRGFSWYEESAGVRHGYWDFRRSWALRTLLPWTLLLDAALAAAIRIYLPLMRGETIVCERFVLDMIVDLAVAIGDDRFSHRRWARCLLRLLPPDALILVLDLDAGTACGRRPGLEKDWRLEDRLRAYRSISWSLGLQTIPGGGSRPVVHQSIIREIEAHHGR